MSLAKISKRVNTLGVILGACAVALMLFAYSDSASARPYGITGGYIKCHGKYKYNGRCHHKKKHHKKHREPSNEEHVVCIMGVPGGSSSGCEPVDDPKCAFTPQGCEPVDDLGCAFMPQGCPPKEEAVTVGGMEVYGFVDKPSYGIRGVAEVHQPQSPHEIHIEFIAEYGSFDPMIHSGPKAEPDIVLGLYEPPCPKAMPADGYDTAWVVVYDLENHTDIESEHVRFNIEHPENLHVPVEH